MRVTTAQRSEMCPGRHLSKGEKGRAPLLVIKNDLISQHRFRWQQLLFLQFENKNGTVKVGCFNMSYSRGIKVYPQMTYLEHTAEAAASGSTVFILCILVQR